MQKYKNCPFSFHLGNLTKAKLNNCWYWRYQDQVMESYGTDDVKSKIKENDGFYPLD